MRRFLIPGLALLALSGGCMNPRTQAYIAQSLTDVSNELNSQRQDMALLQEQIDSLKRVAAHQDSVIKKILNVTGIPPSLATSSANIEERRLRRGQP